ncbi:hypothetical protein DFH94DRAFT_688557 [Russula ochroleuca]|uniref:ABC transporter domain-containing protein n=1 Tax=Russula ochroleuca TaxID=152965 RepID=A0A9P5N4N8_9AGAM|nr:hypothetical protein DFH94DRAFT_700224 [Russula ochroleuca]KAF8486208.1 hypothetical protein DFH94DRAFT_688557 [Russula ochroleuca]
MTVQGGEKIVIFGWTGAGKSSIMAALFRIVELVSVSIIPQDATLFSGTLRSNFDPFGLHDDARLWDALRRSHLVEDTQRISSAKDEEAGVGGDEYQRGTRQQHQILRASR